MGAFWVREPYADLLDAGSHGTTYGGSPLACAVALKILEVIERDHLADNARETGAWFKARVVAPGREISGGDPASARPGPDDRNRIGGENTGAWRRAKNPRPSSSSIVCTKPGALAVPSGAHVIRLLPALNLRPEEAAEGLAIIESVVAKISP